MDKFKSVCVKAVAENSLKMAEENQHRQQEHAVPTAEVTALLNGGNQDYVNMDKPTSVCVGTVVDNLPKTKKSPSDFT
ncbi:hypothetical protein [Acaryochloris sp. CCMEE 5410]|uniref:hypothetical protein n=1 Tax=Acaryochloris sp. CCMEE 5410 TaxID=310037 RepID=UPI000248464B|nr:hypothetical protein [Acaryochloris sp. CCMEE 5410]